MSKTKHRKDHKQKVNNYKNKLKNNMSEKSTVPQMPEVRNIPTWDKNATIEVKGFEWEVIVNAVQAVQVLQQAVSAVMSRNIINGKIQMDFEKLDANTLKYLEMTAEEKVPYLKEFNDYVQTMNAQMESIKNKSLEKTSPEVKQEAVAATEDIILGSVEPIKKEKGKLVKL